MARNIAEQLASRQNAKQVDTGFLSMFGLADGDKHAISKLPIACLLEYEGDPFKDRSGEEMAELMESMSDIGLQQPIVVRPFGEPGQYQILSGRRRKNAAAALGWSDIDAIITELDDTQAVRAVIETNLRYRKMLLPSEKAFAYKMQLDVIKKQGKRSDINGLETSTQNAWKLESAEALAQETNTSRDDIRRHIRLTNLTPALLDMVDTGSIPYMAGYELSFLTHEAQAILEAYLSGDNARAISVKQAQLIKKTAGMQKISAVSDIEALLEGRTIKQKSTKISFNRKRFEPYLKRIPKETDLEALFLEFLQSRFSEVLSSIFRKMVSGDMKSPCEYALAGSCL